jgi:hypothetical protein
VCAVDIIEDDDKHSVLRIIGVYASDSRSWSWDNLSPFVTSKCVFFGDFNVDLIQDKVKGEILLSWADNHSLSPFLPDSPTSLRSSRTIDYALSSEFAVNVQTYELGTSSDHKPLLCSIPIKSKEIVYGRNVHWKVFQCFSAYVYPFWERQWNIDQLDSLYNDYTTFLNLLIARCTFTFPLNKYRIAIPPDLRSFMSCTRALSFKQKRNGDLLLKNIVRTRRKIAKFELRNFLSKRFSSVIASRNTPASHSISFWSKTKRFMKSSSSSLHGFFLPNNQGVEKDPQRMCNLAADYYENLFGEPEVYRPHPYTDIPSKADWDNEDETIPICSFTEVLEVVHSRKKKKSLDPNGLSNYMFSFLPSMYWSLLLKIFNNSYSNGIFPSKWKDSRVLLLAKKEHICSPNATRPISLIDCFLKVNEKIFLTRFNDVLLRRGLLPDAQSGFRSKFRLQTRVLLFFDQILSLMSNGCPVASVFVDFKSAFDALWYDGCIGKLKLLRIPRSYRQWINTWLRDRRAFIEISGKRSRWFNIFRGGPQGSIFTPTLFICYHSDMCEYLNSCLSFMFSDDLAAILAGSIGMKYSFQCLNLEKKLKLFFDQLEFYSVLTVQPLNYDKTQAIFSSRAVGLPKFNLRCGEQPISWTKQFKYLGYYVTPKIGFGLLIEKSMLKIRQRIAQIKSFRLFGKTSPSLRRILFFSYVYPLFVWLFPIYPLFTENQQQNLNHFYLVCFRRVLSCLHFNNDFVAYALDEKTLEDRCKVYWEKYFVALSDTTDGSLIFEVANTNFFREEWLQKRFPVKGVHRTKRFINHTSLIEKCASWCTSIPLNESTINYDIDEIRTLVDFPETF